MRLFFFNSGETYSIPSLIFINYFNNNNESCIYPFFEPPLELGISAFWLEDELSHLLLFEILLCGSWFRVVSGPLVGELDPVNACSRLDATSLIPLSISLNWLDT